MVIEGDIYYEVIKMDKNKINELKIKLNAILETKQDEYIKNQDEITKEVLDQSGDSHDMDEILQNLSEYYVRLNVLTYNNLRELIADSIYNILDSLQD